MYATDFHGVNRGGENPEGANAVAVEVADIGTAATYIRNGLGVGILGKFTPDDISGSGLATVDIADYYLQWRLFVARSATRSPSAAAHALLELIEEFILR